ncbi:hypothetical protein SCLCIDRAFT_111541 [Scleroderma citrinum Foug A]|uniref:Uncharacterized protein n=1 Tax=Scleroderma citrinum Foug A TaxID=1036808 RepID=A0A0C3ECH1_9AGAM|nr:hypothetical protein SCLCIDRAFT_111541 [Scleroderma citrinum Foug A]
MPTSKSHPVPAFYNADEPLLLSMLSSQTEICYQPKTPVCVSAMEEIVILQLPIAVLLMTNTRSTTKMVRMSTPGMSSRATTPREVVPATKLSEKRAEKSVTIIESHRERSDSPSSMESSLLSLDGEEESDRKRIPKPSGEVGWLGRGGYNLEDQLGWGKDGCKKLKQFVKKAMGKYLDPTKWRSLQDRKALETISKMVSSSDNVIVMPTHLDKLGHSSISRP